ncbi:unnamed protein product [Cylicocyclus nassatus]|uniref:Uncharacterized protein n=1 Tax=Cylicocyclus nassatus TaxID=53992 RepID=A0AA36DJY7_CYLNA|nr:unnamed protein product [Cylicocyclus nassatus]
MSVLGSHKAQITNAANALRIKINEVDEATLEPLELTTEADKDPQFILSHKKSEGRQVCSLTLRRARRVSHPPGDPGALGRQWLDQLMEEANTLHDRLDVAIKLLASSELLYFLRNPTVPFSSSLAQHPSLTLQPAQKLGMEIASHPSLRDQEQPPQPDALALADAPAASRAASLSQGFVTSSNPNPTSTLSLEQSLKLPIFEIPTFHGDIGPAANIVAGFQSTVENYDDAVRSLTNTYGRPEILRSNLWDKLTQLPAASDSPVSQRATLAIKAVWNQLQHLKEDSSAIGTIKTIRTKFPRRTRERIGEFKHKGDSMWTVDEDSRSPWKYPSADRRSEAFTRYRTPSRSGFRSTVLEDRDLEHLMCDVPSVMILDICQTVVEPIQMLGSLYLYALAKHLGLTFKNTRAVTTLTFGGHQLTGESSEVTLTLWDQYNRPLQFELWTREKITTVPRVNNSNDNTIVDPEDRVEAVMRTFLGLDTLELDESEDTENAGVIRQFYDTVAIVDDASKRAYATVVYILTRHSDGKPQPTLLFAKAKLAPPGAITIPRMELLACHMAAKMFFKHYDRNVQSPYSCSCVHCWRYEPAGRRSNTR